MKYNNVKLGDYLYIKGRIGWKGLKKEEYLPKSDYRIINGESLTEDGIDWSKAGYISRERYEESPEIMLENKDILISKDGTIGKIGFVESLDGCATVASGIFVIRNQRPQEINTRYVYHFLCSKAFKDFITMRTEGSVIPHLYQKDFVELVVPLPELTVQEKIVSILDAITLKIENNKAINNNLQAQAFALFDELFPSFNDGDMQIGDYISPKRGKNLLSKDAIPGEVPVVAGGLEPATYHNVANTVAPVITISASGANAGFVNLWQKPVWSSDSSFIDSAMTDDVYFWFALLKKRQKEIYDSQTGSAQPHIYPQHISSMRLPSLNMDLVTEYVSRVKPFFALVGANLDESKHLASLRDSLLPKLMSGEIDVSDVEI